MFTIDQIVSAITSYGPAAIGGAVVLFVTVYLFTFTGLLADSNVKRIAVVVLGYLFSGFEAGNLDTAVLTVLSVLGAGLLKLGIDYLRRLKK